MVNFICRYCWIHMESIHCRFLGNPSERIQDSPPKFWPVSVYRTWWKMPLFTLFFLFIMRFVYFLWAFSFIIHPLVFVLFANRSKFWSANINRLYLQRNEWTRWHEGKTMRKMERKRNKKTKDNTGFSVMHVVT